MFNQLSECRNREGVEPTTLQLKVIASTKALPRPTINTFIEIVRALNIGPRGPGCLRTGLAPTL